MLLMLDMILEYQKAVTFCYWQLQGVDLQVWSPNVTEWNVVQRVFECLMPIIKFFVLNEATESWILSDTISSCATLSAKLTHISEDYIPTYGSAESETFHYELEIYIHDAVTGSRD